MASTTAGLQGPPLRGDESELFRRHHRRLLTLVGRDVTARPTVIEDACAYAWLELIARQPERTNVIGWLRIVARREAIRLAQRDRRLAALIPEHPDRGAAEAGEPGVHTRSALRLVAALPERERAVLTLHIYRHSYRETAAQLQMTERTVERQLLRARAAVRTARGESPPRLPRSAGPVAVGRRSRGA
jgi:RNA polymerase sigma factor (sigma-70 family)